MTLSRGIGQVAEVSPEAVVRVLRRSSGRLRLTVIAATPDPAELERRVRGAPGVQAASFSVQTGNLLVTFDPGDTDEQTVLVAITSAVCVAAQPPVPVQRRGAPPQDRDDVAVHDVEPAHGWMAAEGSCVVRATPGDCAKRILDFAAYPEWQQYVTRVEILKRDGRGRGTVVRTQASVGEQAVVHVMRYRYPSATRIAWEQLEGELEAIRGEWRLLSVGPTGTQATYRLEIRPGLRLRLLLRGPLYEQARDTLIAHTLDALRRHIEGTDHPRRS